MILVDTSVWIAHFRSAERAVSERLDEGYVLMHPFVLGEIALGNLKDREATISDLRCLPMVQSASNEDVLRMIGNLELFGSGMNYVDCHLLASVLITDEASLWTRDKNLLRVAQEMSVAAGEPL